MNFIGELCLLALYLFAWSERKQERFYFFLIIALYFIGWTIENFGIQPDLWHYSFGRIFVFIGIFLWSGRKTKRKVFPLCSTALAFIISDLLIVNEPGISPSVLFLIYCSALLISWLVSLSYWGMVYAYIGGLLLKILLTPYSYGGIILYVKIPDPFLWNFSVVSLISIGLIKVYGKKIKEIWAQKKGKAVKNDAKDNYGEDSPLPNH